MSKVNNESMVFTSSVVNLSEEQDYITLRNKVCYFNDRNLNNVCIDYDDSTLEKCQTLVNMPVVARYIKRNNKDDLGGHEVKVVDGRVKFGTATIGVVTAVEIKEEEVETVDGDVKKLPVLYADERIWSRNENYVAAIQRLYSEKKLHSSWEIKSKEYTFKNNVKRLIDYSFLSNCLLGSKSYPAYGKKGAVVTDVSEVEDEYEYLAAETMLEEALAMDVESASASNDNSVGKEEDEIVDVNEKVLEDSELDENTAEAIEAEEVVDSEEHEEQETNEPEVSEDSEQSEEEAGEDTKETSEEKSEDVSENISKEVSEDNVEEDTQDQSAMKTFEDIWKMIRAALRSMEETEDHWYEISMVFPEDKVVLLHDYSMQSLQFVKYTYQIEGDAAVLSDRQEVELVVSPLQINSEIEKKNNALAEANNQIVELQAQVNELAKAKEELDKIRAEQETAEHDKKVEQLRNYAKNSGQFSEEEMNSEAFNEAISSLNESWVKSEIADRLVASFAKTQENKEAEVNTSEVDTKKSIVLSDTEGKDASPEDVMRAFFNGD